MNTEEVGEESKLRPTIEWTRAKLARFNSAYQNSVADGKDIFIFEGHEFVVGYAKYLIEYLDGVLV